SCPFLPHVAEILVRTFRVSLKSTMKVQPMNDGGVRRREKTVKPGEPETASAKILKFDRRAGVVVLENRATASRPRSLLHLVQDLLKMLRHSPGATPSRRQPRPNDSGQGEVRGDKF